MGFFKNLVKTVTKPAKGWVDTGVKIAVPIMNAVAPGTGSVVQGLANAQSSLLGAVTGSQRANAGTVLGAVGAVTSAMQTDYSGLNAANAQAAVNTGISKLLGTNGNALPMASAPAVAAPIKSAVRGSLVADVTAPVAQPTKAAAAKGILGTNVSTGNDTIDSIIGGVVTGGIKGAVTKDQGAKDLLGAASGVAAESWLEKNWYFIAGGIIAVIFFLRGRK